MIPPWLREWILSNEGLLWWIGLLSLGLLVVGAILLPVILVHLPRDYLRDYLEVKGHSRPCRFSSRPLRRQLYMLGRNLLGGLLVLAGIAMLTMPGQGLVSIAVGLALMDFPRKRAFLRLVVKQKHVLRAINRLRGKFKQPPLAIPEAGAPDREVR